MSKVLLVLLGESGTGKTTIANRLKQKYGMKELPSYTTRPKRKEDEEGHTFVSLGEFMLLKNKVAANKYRGNFYCATKEQVEEYDTYVCDCKGIKMLKETYKGDKKIIVVRLTCPREERKRRMEKDNRSPQEILLRDSKDPVEFQYADMLADYMLDNDNLEETVDAVRYIYEKECEEG